MTKYRVIDKSSSLFGRIGVATFIEHDDGLKVLRFRKKGRPYPTRAGYTHGFYPQQLEVIK